MLREPREHAMSSALRNNRLLQLSVICNVVLVLILLSLNFRPTPVPSNDTSFGGLYGAPGSPKLSTREYAVAPQPCNCNCQCTIPATASSTALTSPIASCSGSATANVAGAGLARLAVGGSGASNPFPGLDVQMYGALPSVQDDSYMQYVRAAYPPVGPEKGSLLDPAYLSTPIAYGTHFVPAQPNDGFPTGFIPRPACQKDSDLVQEHIYKNQHPADCKTAKLFVRRHMPGYGLFAGLGLSSNYVFLAAILGRTLIDLSPNTYFTGNCESNGLTCAFLPITSCTAADFEEKDVCYDASCWETARVISIDRSGLTDFLPCAPTEFPKDRCNRSGGPKIHRTMKEILPGLGNHGEQFMQQEFSRYLTRPNRALAEYTAGQMKELQLTDQLIAVHIRHGDKMEGIQFPTRAYSLIVRRAVQITGIKTVFIGSDDKSVYEELPRWVDLPGITYKWMNPDLNPIVFSAAEAGRKGKNTIGLNLMAQTIIFTQAQVYIGTRSSNAGQIVYAMQGNDCQRQKIAYDMYGDLFYNSWYCRGDIEHAGREWMCALQKPGPGEGLIWKWGGARTEC